jgi:WD40 repeat protein
VHHAAFSPDGRRVVTASDDRTARVWDTASGQPVTPPLTHQDQVWHAAFSPDGRRVVTASWDQTARVWDAASGQPLSPPLSHQNGVLHAAFSPDGRRVVTASGESSKRGEALVWDLAPDDQPTADLMLLTQLLHGHRLDRLGALVRLSPEEQRAAFQTLSAKYPQDFTVTPAQALAWHQREAEACVREKNPAAALFHTLHGSWAWAVQSGWPRP